MTHPPNDPLGRLGQVDGCTTPTATVVGWLENRTSDFRDCVAFVAIDPAGSSTAAICSTGFYRT
jgi:hypothetical protein